MKIVSFTSKVLLSVLYLVDYKQKAKENDIEGAKKMSFYGCHVACNSHIPRRERNMPIQADPLNAKIISHTCGNCSKKRTSI